MMIHMHINISRPFVLCCSEVFQLYNSLYLLLSSLLVNWGISFNLEIVILFILFCSLFKSNLIDVQLITF
jgi:hypothetical protein